MKIVKTGEEVTYKRETVTMTFEVNGKTVKCYEETSYSSYGDDEYDYNLDEDNLAELTDIEAEAIGEELIALLKLPIGEEVEVDITN